MNIRDIPIYDLHLFLKINNIRANNTDDVYRFSYELITEEKMYRGTIYKDVPNSIIEWKMAYLIKNKKDIPIYHINEIENLSYDEFDLLTNKLNMKSRNMDQMINILRYAGKFRNTIKTKYDYTNKNFLDTLERQLLSVNYDKKLYHGLEVYDLRAGDRVFSHENMHPNKEQFIIISVNNNVAEMMRVDVLGNISNEIRESYLSKDGWSSYWGYLYPGILLFDNGPEIKDLNSPYLKYKVLSITDDKVPELNMIVTVTDHSQPIGSRHKLYFITELTKDYILLRSINTKLIHYIEVIKKNNRWMIDPENHFYDDYSLLSIGGFLHKGNYY